MRRVKSVSGQLTKQLDPILSARDGHDRRAAIRGLRDCALESIVGFPAALRSGARSALAEVYNASASLTRNKSKEEVCVDHCGCWQSVWGSSWHGLWDGCRRKGTRLSSLTRIT